MKLYLTLFFCIILSYPLCAQWGTTPAENLILSEEQGVKLNKLALAGPDGSWYICYTNLVVNTQSLHLARVDEVGQIIWAKTIKAGDEPGSLSAVMISDSLGGVILAWTDRRIENTAFTYANRIDSDGNKLWGEEDMRIGISEIEESCIKMVPDGQHGAWITVYDDNPPQGDFRGIYAYRIYANGTVPSRTYLFPGSNNCEDYAIARDGQSGLLATTKYLHPLEAENQIRAMRIDSIGAKIWPDEAFDIGPISQPIGMKIQGSTRSYTYPSVRLHPGIGPYILYFENPGINYPNEEIKHRGHLLSLDGTHEWPTEGIALNRPSINSPDIQTLVDHEENLYFNYHTDSAFKLQKVTPEGTLPWGMDGIPYTTAFQGAPDNLLLTTCNDIIIGIDGGPDEIIEAIRINSMGQMVYVPDASIPLSINTTEVQDRDPITAINADDQVIALWNRDEDIGDAHMDVYVQGFGKDGVLGGIVNSTRNFIVQSISAYPNPAQNSIQLQFGAEAIGITITIKDIHGRTIFSRSIEEPNYQLDISLWPSGIYLLTGQSSRLIYTGKIFKQ